MPKNWIARSVGGAVLLLAACQGVVPPPPAQVRPAPPIVVSLTGDVGIVVAAGSRNDVLADVWRRAAAEQGLPAVVVDEAGAPASHAALILPMASPETGRMRRSQRSGPSSSRAVA
jgi:hypothetical protein